MRIDLDGRRVLLAGRRHSVAEAAAAALTANGAIVGWTDAPAACDIAILSHPLDLEPGYRPEGMISFADETAALMGSSGGRVLHLVPSAATLPMRRHPEASVAMAAVVAAVRTLAMQAAPHVLVNALACGLLEADARSGDPAMATHVPLARAGRIDEAVATLLFLADPMNSYTTGQVLAVDGGWSAGYGRDF